MKYKFIYAYRNKSGKFIERKSFGSYEDRATCDRILSLRLSELEEEGYSEVQGDIVEVDG